MNLRLARCPDTEYDTMLPELASRFSCRRFVPDEYLSAHRIEMLIKAAGRAPSGCNRQPWRFIVIQDHSRIVKVSHLTFDQDFVKDSSCVIVVLGDPAARGRDNTEEKLWELERARAFTRDDVDRALAEYKIVGSTGSTSEDPCRDMVAVVRDCSLAAYGLMLQATRMGLATCWVSIRDTAGLLDLCAIPSDLIMICMIAIGKSVEVPPHPRPRSDVSDFVYAELFGKQMPFPGAS